VGLRHALAIPFWVGIAGSANAGFRDAFIDPLDGSLDASKYLSEYKLGFFRCPWSSPSRLSVTVSACLPCSSMSPRTSGSAIGKVPT
jgi:hypothetical protein